MRMVRNQELMGMIVIGKNAWRNMEVLSQREPEFLNVLAFFRTIQGNWGHMSQ